MRGFSLISLAVMVVGPIDYYFLKTNKNAPLATANAFITCLAGGVFGLITIYYLRKINKIRQKQFEGITDS